MPEASAEVKWLGMRRFDFADQETFAAISGDRNPIHFDALTARREFAKQPIVHGAHLLLWALELWFEHCAPARPIAGIQARFENYTPVGAVARVRLAASQAASARLEIVSDDQMAATVVVSFGDSGPVEATYLNATRFAPAIPIDLRFEDLPGALDKGICSAPSEGVERVFPWTCRALGQARVAGIACASFIVGMVCPGQSSLFRSLRLTTTSSRQDQPELHFELARLDPRFKLIRLSLNGAGWTGWLEAHFRPGRVAQPSMEAAAAKILPGEFAGARALIVGGSRGLGETIAKLIAAGGGDVMLTYSQGELDARRVQTEIAGFGANCEILSYDAAAEPADQLGSRRSWPNQIYYMASPAIVARGAGGFRAAAFEAYRRVFIDGLYELCRSLLAERTRRLSLFYPSSIFVESRPPGFTEYAMAKAAGEILCADLQAAHRILRIAVSRLPKLETDQTASLASERFPDTIETLAPLVRQVQAGSAD